MHFEELLVNVKANMKNVPIESWKGDAEESIELQVDHEDLPDTCIDFWSEKFVNSYQTALSQWED